jgi:hypothetical protein
MPKSDDGERRRLSHLGEVVVMLVHGLALERRFELAHVQQVLRRKTGIRSI